MKKSKPKQKANKSLISKLATKRNVLIATLLIFSAVGFTLLKPSSAVPYDGWQRIRILNMATSQLGVKERPGVYKYSEDKQENWCADFVSWVYKEAGYPFITSSAKGRSSWRIPLVYIQHKGVPNLRDYLKSHNAYRTKESGYRPGIGDIVIFARNGRSHTGIIEKSDNSKIYTIEGNTSTDNVARRSYSIKDATIDGYGTIIASGPKK